MRVWVAASKASSVTAVGLAREDVESAGVVQPFDVFGAEGKVLVDREDAEDSLLFESPLNYDTRIRYCRWSLCMFEEHVHGKVIRPHADTCPLREPAS
jgi:hypothetical protein